MPDITLVVVINLLIKNPGRKVISSAIDGRMRRFSVSRVHRATLFFITDPVMNTAKITQYYVLAMLAEKYTFWVYVCMF